MIILLSHVSAGSALSQMHAGCMHPRMKVLNVNYALHQHNSALLTHVACGGAYVQVRITPPFLGTWAVQSYGSLPTRVDALTFRTAHLAALKLQLDDARRAWMEGPGGIGPDAAHDDGDSDGVRVDMDETRVRDWKHVSSPFYPTVLVTFR